MGRRIRRGKYWPDGIIEMAKLGERDQRKLRDAAQWQTLATKPIDQPIELAA
jgi:hypothetical protein